MVDLLLDANRTGGWQPYASFGCVRNDPRVEGGSDPSVPWNSEVRYGSKCHLSN
jgi:hypothetical protein